MSTSKPKPGGTKDGRLKGNPSAKPGPKPKGKGGKSK